MWGGSRPGFNASNVRNLRVSGAELRFDVETAIPAEAIDVRFAGLDPAKSYRLVVNGRPPVERKGSVLRERGFKIEP